MQIIRAVPTNIITGALGAGKTTLIKVLLKAKPAKERWAVLVNEFGEIGIDGALLNYASQAREQVSTSVVIREVPGGCMCCASGLPMQIALNQLLALAKPDRLLIEPTGLGHPKELLQVLSSEHYKEVLSLESVFCLSDARKLKEPKWRAHQTFQEQFQIADVVIATKHDLYQREDEKRLNRYLSDILDADVPVLYFDEDKADSALFKALSQKSKASLNCSHTAVTRRFQDKRLNEAPPFLEFDSPAQSTLVKSNQGEGFYSKGWCWPASYQFQFFELKSVLRKLELERMKAVMITDEGIFGFNGQRNEIALSEYDEAAESRLEIIADSAEKVAEATKLIESLSYIR